MTDQTQPVSVALLSRLERLKPFYDHRLKTMCFDLMMTERELKALMSALRLVSALQSSPQESGQ